MLRGNVFPNPAKDELFIECDKNNALVCISDMNGRTFITKVFSGKETISISHLSKGIYICTISKNGVSARYKFVKE
jgi:aminopeptidase YwaD